MKNKKFLIVAIIILIIGAIGFGVFKIYSSYLFNLDGTITDGHAELINKLNGIEDKDERKEMIDASVERNFITQEEANELY